MLNFGNKEFRNLQEQVEKNAADILTLNYGGAVLSEFGIKVVGQINSASDLPDPSLYEETDVGNAYAVETLAPCFRNKLKQVHSAVAGKCAFVKVSVYYQGVFLPYIKVSSWRTH